MVRNAFCKRLIALKVGLVRVVIYGAVDYCESNQLGGFLCLIGISIWYWAAAADSLKRS